MMFGSLNDGQLSGSCSCALEILGSVTRSADLRASNANVYTNVRTLYTSLEAL